MSGRNLSADNPLCHRAMELIEKEPGLEREEIGIRIGCSYSWAGAALRVLRESNLVGSVPFDSANGCRSRGWFAAGDLPGARAAWRRDHEAKRKARVKKASAVRRAREAAMLPETEDTGMPVQRRIDAGSKRPLPFRCEAPNSVFALGCLT